MEEAILRSIVSPLVFIRGGTFTDPDRIDLWCPVSYRGKVVTHSSVLTALW